MEPPNGRRTPSVVERARHLAAHPPTGPRTGAPEPPPIEPAPVQPIPADNEVIDDLRRQVRALEARVDTLVQALRDAGVHDIP